jgi:hypothetical protein
VVYILCIREIIEDYGYALTESLSRIHLTEVPYLAIPILSKDINRVTVHLVVF